jgi:hypothetical protein
MSGSIFPAANPLMQQQSSIYGAQQQQSLNALMPGAANGPMVPLPQQQPGGPNDPMAQYMQWLMAPQGQQQQPGPAPMMPVGIPLPQYAPTPPGMAPTGPVATGSTADPYGLNAWALQQGMAAQGGGWGGYGYGQGAGGGQVGGAAGNQASAGVGTADVGGVGRGF